MNAAFTGNKYFYSFLAEDRVVLLLMLMPGKINHTGRCKVQETFNRQVFTLNTQSLQSLLSRLQTFTPISGRCYKRPLDITFDLQGYVRKLSELGIKLTLHGGALWHMISSMLENILNEWLSDTEQPPPLDILVSQLFEATMKSSPNDFDWQIRPSYAHTIESLISHLVEYLAKNLAEQDIDMSELNEQLKFARQRAQEKLKTSYPYKLFERHPQNPSDKEKLCQLFVEAFAFNAAADVSTDEAQFSLRSLGEGIGQDLLFPITSRITPTWLNSLFVDVTELIKLDELPAEELSSLEVRGHHRKLDLQSQATIILPDVQLQSILGKSCEDILQAIVSKFINLMYYDPFQSLDSSDFAHIMAQFTFCSRSLQRGLFAALIKGLQKECLVKQESLGSLIAKGLTNYVLKHCSNDFTVLIALTFNAAAHLSSCQEICELDIHELWEKVMTSIGHYLSIAPIIAIIQQRMSSGCHFETLYACIQVYAHVAQNHLGTSISFPTQTNEQIYTQIRIQRSPQSKQNLEVIALMFPYDLVGALNHLATLTKLPECCSALHNAILGTQPLAFGLGKSQLAPYADDDRRDFDLSLQHALQLLHHTEENLWSLGHLLVHSLLAQKFAAPSLADYLVQFLDMLHGSWPNEQFKRTQLDLLMVCLQHSGIHCDSLSFQKAVSEPSPQYSIYKELLCVLMKESDSLFTEASMKLLEHMHDTTCKDTIRECYLALIKMMPSAEVMTAILTSFQQSRLPLNFQLKYYMLVYSKLGQNWSQASHLEEELFESIVLVLNFMDKKHVSFGQQAHIFDRIVRSMLNSSNRSNWPLMSLDFVKNLWRLSLMGDLKHANKCWGYLVKLCPITSADCFHFSLQCFTLAHECGWWPKLQHEQKEAFNSQLKTLIRQNIASAVFLENSLPLAEHPQLLQENKHVFQDLLQDRVNMADFKEEYMEQFLSLISLWTGLANTFPESSLLYKALKKVETLSLTSQHLATSSIFICKFKENFATSYVEGLSEGCAFQELLSFYSGSQQYFTLTPSHYAIFLKCVLHYSKEDATWMPEEKLLALLDSFEKSVSLAGTQQQADTQKLYLLLTARYLQRKNYEAALNCQSMALACMAPPPEFYTQAWKLFIEIAQQDSVSLAEKALEQILQKTFCRIRSHSEQQQSCLLLLLDNLQRHKSKIFLSLDLWQNLHSNFFTNPQPPAAAMLSLMLSLMLKWTTAAIAQRHAQDSLNQTHKNNFCDCDQLANKIYTLALKPKLWEDSDIPSMLLENRVLILCHKTNALQRGINNIVRIIQSEQASNEQKCTAVTMANHFVSAMLPFKQKESIALVDVCINAMYKTKEFLKEIDHSVMLQYLSKMHEGDIEVVLQDILNALKQVIKSWPKKEEKSQVRTMIAHLLPRYISSDFVTRNDKNNTSMHALDTFFSWLVLYFNAYKYVKSEDLSSLNRILLKDQFLSTYHPSRRTFITDLNIVLTMICIAVLSNKFIFKKTIPPDIAFLLFLFFGISYAVSTLNWLNGLKKDLFHKA